MQMSLIFGGFPLSEVEDVSVSSRRAPGTAGPGGGSCEHLCARGVTGWDAKTDPGGTAPVFAG